MSDPKHLVIIAGEASGDMHAAHLVDAIKRKNPNVTFSGLGGDAMRQSGVEIYEDLASLAVVGFAEVLKVYGRIRQIFYVTLEKIKETKPDAVILVDYPGFNLRLAKKVKQMGIKVIYYISPQVWAWKESRVKFIKKYVDTMMVVFKFEQEFYEQRGIKVEFVGHPLIDGVKAVKPKDVFLKNLKMEDYKTTVGILPGSREKEIDRHLPVMLKTAARLRAEFPMMQFLIVKAPTIERGLITQYTFGLNFPYAIVENQTYDAVNACDVCMVTSGTATLETAILGKPMVVIYKTSWLTWMLAKLFVKIENIGLVNIVAQKRIVPECIQNQANPKTIAREITKLFRDEAEVERLKNKLAEVKNTLGEGGASQKAASVVLSSLR